MSACYKTSDNKHFDCPPRMADGRHFTDYRPSCHVNDLLKADNAISNSFQYRKFLQENADTLMNKNREIACAKNCCAPCVGKGLGVEGFNNGTMLPEKYVQECNANFCKVVINDVNGIGTGRKYYSQGINQCDNLPSAWPVIKQPNMCATPLDNFAYLGDLERAMMPQMLRVAVPGAGNVLDGGDPMQRTTF
jgi:hypothetical protein